jgi:hypothetical protein
MGSLNHAGAIQAAAKEAAAQQAQQQQQQLAAWSARESEHFAKMIEHEATPQRREAVKAEFQAFARENNLSMQQISTIFAQNPAMQSAAFSRLVWDALSHRAAKRTATANPASRSRVAPVMKPGVAKSRGEVDASEISELREEFKRATGKRQLDLAVRLHQKQRAARG